MSDSPYPAKMPLQDLDLSWRPEDPALSERIYRSMLAELVNPAGDGDVFRVELLTQIARAEAAQGKHAEAFTLLETGAKLLGENTSDAATRAKIRLLLEEGRVFTVQRTPAQARTRFSKAWELAVRAGEDFFVVEIARAMAEIEPLKMQEVWIRKAIEVARGSKTEKARLWLGVLYEDLGWKLFELRQFEASLAAYQSALESHQALESTEGILRAKWAVGRLLRQLRRVTEALAWNEALLPETSGKGPLYGRLCEEVAECLLTVKGPEAAQPYFARAYHELSPASAHDRHPLGLKRLKQLGKVE
jgi:tetratricopeptide (TPR) repeat protein